MTNPNATITITNPSKTIWNARFKELDPDTWRSEMPNKLSVEITDTPLGLANQIKRMVVEGYQVVEINAMAPDKFGDDDHVGTWEFRHLRYRGLYGLKLYGPEGGVAHLQTPIQAIDAIVRTHSDGWRLDTATGELVAPRAES